MQPLKILLSIDEQGKIALPMDILNNFGIRVNTKFRLFADEDNGKILLQKFDPRRQCPICGKYIDPYEYNFEPEDEDCYIEYDGKNPDRIVCQKCVPD